MKKTIDLNCDMGESFGSYKIGNDEAIMPLISSANVACGFHAGDPHVMRRTVSMAQEYGVAVGAHPGLPDLVGFGRRHLKVSPEEIKDYFVYQIGALKAFLEAAGMRLQHVKQHGALFKMALDDESLALAMAEATREVDPDLIFLTPTGTNIVEVAKGLGLKVGKEAYADRAYNVDMSLVARSIPGSVIKDPAEINGRIERLMKTNSIDTMDGQTLELDFDSICLHGDTPGASDIIASIRRKLDDLGVKVSPVSEII